MTKTTAASSSLFGQLGPSPPLAEILRPKNLGEVLGQDHLLKPDSLLGLMITAKQLSSLILWGGPGCGKTTIARLLSHSFDLHYVSLSAVFSGVGELRKCFEEAKNRREQGQGTLLFIDEIHRFNKSQQDAFLPVVEDGTITLIGATTENPSFELNGALLSRCQVLVLEPLLPEDLEILLTRAETHYQKKLPLNDEARAFLLQMADQDGRYLLSMADILFAYGNKPDQPLITQAALPSLLQKRRPLYDKGDEQHYNLISALHKSLRGSDVDAALYWFSRMIDGGEDPLYIARRLMRFAYEDIGMADPQAALQAEAATQCYTRLGTPEGEIALAHLVVYLATAPKSNAVYSAQKSALRHAKVNGSFPPPKHILNAPTKLMKTLGYGADYAYDHDSEESFSGQNYFPDNMQRKIFYEPKPWGFEKDIAQRLAYWQKLRLKRLTEDKA